MVPHIVGGFLLLFFGRKMFWLFVGITGFLAGTTFGAYLLQGQPAMIHWAFAIGLGIIGILLALFAQKLAVVLAGFYSGGYFLITILDAANFNLHQPMWVPFVVGGIIGAILLSVMFDWALILISSLVGATALVRTMNLTLQVEALCFFALVIIGIMSQAKMMATDRREGR